MDSLVTVLIPVADTHLPYLPRALYSLTQQTYLPQVLVVNDSHQELTLPVNHVNTGGGKGSAYARNLGLDYIKTPFTFFLDADDYLLDTALEVFLRNAATSDACYLYSDWLQYNEKGYSTHLAKTYDRKRMLRHSIHLVSIFLETDLAKSIYYDINYRGWEDWEFHIRMGAKGFCGDRIPEPLLIYDMTTSINREKHNSMQDEVYQEIITKYEEYLEGGKEFMACNTCGGNQNRVQQQVKAMPPEAVEGMLMVEYLGENTAPVTYKVGRNVYRGANDDANKFVNVWAQDVPELLDKGPWRRVAKSAKPVTVPQPEQFQEWRATQEQVVIPKSWQDLFSQNAITSTPPEEPPVKKPRGRPKGTRVAVPEPTIERDTIVENAN